MWGVFKLKVSLQLAEINSALLVGVDNRSRTYPGTHHIDQLVNKALRPLIGYRSTSNRARCKHPARNALHAHKPMVAVV